MSAAGDAVRDYARETATHTFTVSATGNPVEVPIGQRGELAGKAFVALQEVLEYVGRADFFGDPLLADNIRAVIEGAMK